MPQKQQQKQQQQQYDFNNNNTPQSNNYGQYNSASMGNYQEGPNNYEDSGPANLVPCGNCGRNFAADRLSKHMKICQKIGSKPKKVFDSTRARIQGTEAASFQRMRKPDPPKKKNNWRSKHGKNIQIIRCLSMYFTLNYRLFKVIAVI